MVAAIIILAICVPVTAIVSGYFAFKGVQYGLRWQIETKQEQKPTMDPVVVPKPFDQLKQQDMLPANLLDEWINGPREKEVN